MLGIDKKETLKVEGHFAIELREAVRRARTGRPNADEQRARSRSEHICKEYNVVWK